MDDDHALQCHLELMHALQTRRLRRVGVDEKPQCIGGSKEYSHSPLLVGLQAEFLQSSLAMQKRLRPQLERMTDIKIQSVHDEQWKSTLRELRHEHGRRNLSSQPIREPRMLYQLDELIESIPGWRELQDEIKLAEQGKRLEPVEVDGFYVIKTIPNDDQFFSIKR